MHNTNVMCVAKRRGGGGTRTRTRTRTRTATGTGTGTEAVQSPTWEPHLNNDWLRVAERGAGSLRCQAPWKRPIRFIGLLCNGAQEAKPSPMNHGDRHAGSHSRLTGWVGGLRVAGGWWLVGVWWYDGVLRWCDGWCGWWCGDGRFAPSPKSSAWSRQSTVRCQTPAAPAP